MSNLNIKELYKPLSKGVFRTPVYKLEIFKKLFNANKGYDELCEEILSFYNDKIFMEIVYLSSYPLYVFLESFVAKSDSSKKRNLIASMAKYISRASTRATPFGLNAGIGIFSIVEEQSKITINNQDTHKRRVRLDNHFVRELYSYISDKFHIDFYYHTKYFSNPTLYQKGEYKYYIERIVDKAQRISYGSAKVQTDEVLEYILDITDCGLKIEQIKGTILSTFLDVDAEEVVGFINELIESNLIINEFELLDTSNVTFFDKLISFLSSNQLLGDINNSLIKVRDIVSEIDNSSIGLNCISNYNSIKQTFLEIGLPEQMVNGNIFHVDLEISSHLSNYNKKEAINNLEILDLLLKVSEKREFESIKNFKRKFLERYGDAEIGILEALNKETGIGYDKRNIDDAYPDTLTDVNIKYNSSAYNLSINSFQTSLIKKISSCLMQGDSIIKLQKSDIENIQYDVHKLPNTINLIFTKIFDEETQSEKTLIHPTGNSSAASMISRFSNNHEIANLCNEIINKDKFANGIIDIEFNQIAQFRSLNVIHRNFTREHEISIFATKMDESFKLSEIFVGIYNNRIYLRNKITGDIINPHISHVFDFQNDISLFTFIGDIQQEYSYSPLMFSWYNIAKIFPHRPRLEYKSYILYPESWNVNYSDFKPLYALNETYPAFLEELSIICNRLSLKKNIVIAEDDLELPINLDQPFSVNIFLQILKRKRKITVLENLQIHSTDIIEDKEKYIYANQIIIPYCLNDIIKNKKVDKYLVDRIALNNEERNIFPFSALLLYLKIYGGKQLLEEVLINDIYPLIASYVNEDKIEKWFFIRYADPDFHFRIRIFFINDQEKALFSKNLSNILTKAKENGFINKVSLDTYERELERYDPNIEAAEMMFFYDSECILKILNLKRNISQDSFTLLVLWYIDFVITERFKLSIEEKLALLNNFSSAMFSQMDLNKVTKVSIDSKFRSFRPLIIHALKNGIIEGVNLEFYKQQFLELNYEGVDTIFNNEQIGSFLHMSINRIFVSNQNLNELVIYSLLQKYNLFVFKNKNVSLR